MQSTTQRRVVRLRESLSIVHTTVGWLALSVLLPLGFSVMPFRDRSNAYVLAWVLLSVVAAVIGPVQVASTLANDRHSGFIAFEQQRTGRSVLALLKEYAIDGQRFFVTAPLATAPMLWWLTREEPNRLTAWYPLIAVAAQLSATVAALAVASSTDHRDAPSSTSGLSVLAVFGALGFAGFALSALEQPATRSFVPLALLAISVAALVVGVARKLHDEEAPFFTPGVAIATQSAVVLAMLPIAARSRAVEDGPFVLRTVFAFALVVSLLARNRAHLGAQDLLRWKLDDQRRSLDPRDPRRALLLSIVLSAACGVALLWAPAMDHSTIGTFVLGAALLVASAAHAVVRRADRRVPVAPAFVFTGIALLAWTLVAMVAEPDSLVHASCPTLLAQAIPLSQSAFTARIAFVSVVVAALSFWAQRSFARATAASVS